MANFLRLTQASSGAPALSGANGTLVAILDWALPQMSWTIDYTSGNIRFYRRPAGGALLYVNDDSAVSGSAALATVRGAESRSTATPVDPFPTVAQVANASSTWAKSSNVSATARDYTIYVSDKMVRFYQNPSGTIVSDMMMFGDAEGLNASDAYGTCIRVRNNSNIGTTNIAYNSSSTISNSGTTLFFMRDISGAIKSTHAVFYSSASSALGSVTGTPAAGAGWANAIEREKIGISCFGSASTTVGSTARIKRGWIPNLWAPLHLNIAAYTPADTHTDTAYNASAVFRVTGLQAASNATQSLIEEESNTWNPPSG